MLVILLLLLLSELVELGANAVVLARHPIELPTEVVVDLAHSLPQVVLGPAEVGSLTVKFDDGAPLTEA